MMCGLRMIVFTLGKHHFILLSVYCLLLDHIDILAPYTGLLLKHIDELLLYAEVGENEEGEDDYAFAEQLLPYLEVYVSQLDLIGPHLPLLRPHLPLLLKHNRIAILSPHVGKLFAKGYTDLSGK